MLIGYLENLASDRRIIATVSLRLDLLLFIGYTLDEPLPWHSTLSRTRQLYSQEVFLSLFQQVLKQCIDKGMVAGVRQAIDSALIKANASMDSLAEKQVLEDVQASAGELQDNEEPTVTARRKKRVEEHHAWKKKNYGGPGANHVQTKFYSYHTHYSTTDPEAKIAVKPGKPRQLNNLSQVAVDTAHHVITGMQAASAGKRDSQCLPVILEQTLAKLQKEGLQVEEILADTGYSSGQALKAREEKGIRGFIPAFGQYKPERPGFTYHPQGDYYTCVKGVKMLLKKGYIDKNGYSKNQYRSSRKDCLTCPLKQSCIGSSYEKKIEDTADKPYFDRMYQRMQSRYARRMIKVRQNTVEPVLGTLINFLAMKRINTRGMESAHKCLLMAAVAYNLLKFRPVKATSQVIALARRPLTDLLDHFLAIEAEYIAPESSSRKLEFSFYSEGKLVALRR